jgi:hypothetical protein
MTRRLRGCAAGVSLHFSPAFFSSRVPTRMSRQLLSFGGLESMQLTDVKGLDMTLKQAHEFKYTSGLSQKRRGRPVRSVA